MRPSCNIHSPAVIAVAWLLHTAASFNISLSPAATEVLGSDLLPEETLQLTNAALESAISEVVPDVPGQLVNNGSLALVNTFSFATNTSSSSSSSSQCKTYTGDSLWPDEQLWKLFNGLLGDNALLEVPPIASPCYTNWDNYDAETCDFISDNFTDSHLHAGHPSSIMSPFYEGATCMPIDGAPANCTIGGYPYYVVNVTNVAQIQLAVNFARNQNLRLVIKNTGHDFAGKSSGGSALSIWTHHLKTISYLPSYNSSTYSGKALKIGSGAQAIDIYLAAKENGVTVVGGEGQTVGVSGGYIQGGGHSPLAGIYGLAADSALEFDVITADGNFITASETEHPDLFWALRGGGGSTFGVVAAVTVKAWPQIGVTTTSFTFSTSDTLSTETFWSAMYSYWKNFQTFADAGTYGYFRIWPLGDNTSSSSSSSSSSYYYFSMTPFFAPNMTVAETEVLLKPWTDDLTGLGIDLALNLTYYDNFYDAWYPSFPIESVGGSQGRFASRLLPRANWADETIMNATFAVIRNTTDGGYYFTGFNMKNQLHPANTANSANPAWRGSLVHGLTSYAWTGEYPTTDEMKEMWEIFNNTVMTLQRDITPGSGSYLGEADASEPNFQQSFWGSNYERLLSIKEKYDPYDLFYATNAVGSEFWTIETASGLPTQDGKLCRRTA